MNVELVALTPVNVELETTTSVKFTLVRFAGSVVVELMIVEVPFIPSKEASVAFR